MTVGIVDYGAGNFASVWNAFQQHGHKMSAITRPTELRNCSHIVLPGVGAFSSAMQQLDRLGMVEPLRDALEAGAVPFLGICVGMQVLATRGTEFTQTEGLGAIEGIVTRMDMGAGASTLALPHMGWNDVRPPKDTVLFRGIDSEDRSFYFLHSYALRSNSAAASFAHCDYGGSFIAALERGFLFGVQFHPEKSQRNGHRLIANFLEVGHG
jgi:imidazole glycerol phosphate synthase glutamine amidotransferase subunit